MSSLQWLLCFALLAQVCALAKNYGIRGTIELVDYSGKDVLEFSAKEQPPDDGTDSELDCSYNEAETRPLLKEVLRNQNDSYKNEISCSDGNQARVNEELRPNLNYTQRRARLLGGTDVALGINVQFFFNVLVEGVSILGTQNKYCGGAILSKFWVLTAAQCVVGVDPVRVYAGSAIDPLNTVTPIDAVFRYPHEKFVRNTLLNDIAVIKLVKPLALGGTISTIRLSTVSIHTLGGVSFRTYGWGPPDDSTTLPVPPILKFIEMKNFKKSDCLEKLQGSFLVYPPSAGCLSTSEGTKGICFADAGGPVTYIDEIEDSERVVGINSYSLDCPSLYPSSYTIVLPYLKWIKKTTRLTFT
ncbi:Hypothetical predicted protein [Cloeon dipterum]|uniref:Peptidase S1 domain-containing protein n=1 Tax=Cloeon dipterum TaxID=197152 RepID=A0A8S1DJZ4_9INSE|nr:Hypothetical predicted protein [Cloeon dipterum]